MASDSLGWVYQFWQSKRKKEVNQSGNKIGADELPAVTQLFTEPYMVSFLLDNSLGAWWAWKRMKDEGERLKDEWEKCRTEADCRRLLSLPGVPLEYLRFVRPPSPTATGAGDATLPSPSGRGAGGEGVKPIGYRPLPELNVACSGLSVNAAKEEWKQLALDKKNLRIALGWMYDNFQDAPSLGSLINPAKSDAAKIVQWEELSLSLERALTQEQTDDYHEAAVVAQGLSKAAKLLMGKYHWIITNVPYLARGKQDERLKDFCGKYYPAAKNDLATVFLDRCLEFCAEGGTTSIVLPQNWLFLTTYKKFREKLLKNDTWHLIARLGAGAFETISGEVVKAILVTLSRGNKVAEASSLWNQRQDAAATTMIRGLDVSEPRTATRKAVGLRTAEIKSVEQAKQLENPESTVILDDVSDLPKLGDLAGCYLGVCTGDYQRFGRNYWELPAIANGWNLQRVTVDRSMHWGGMKNVLLWEDGSGSLFDFVEERLGGGASGTWLRGKMAWEKMGVAIKQMRDLPAAIYSGELYNNNVAVLIPKDISHLLPIWVFCSSPSFNEEVRNINQTLAVDTQYLLSVPFDLDYWTKVAEEKYPNGLPKPYSDDPTQWIFHGHPCGSVVWDEEKKWTTHGPLRTDSTVLQVAVARLLGYRWPAELVTLTPNPSPSGRGEQENQDDPLPLGEGGHRPGEGKMELSDEQREWVNKCNDLLKYIDPDGIVCIQSVRGEEAADSRLRALLVAAFGSDWSPSVEKDLIKAAGSNASNLDEWLRDHFFEQHCKLFHHRPFIWHIWDGRRRDGFHALVNYHKLAEGNGKGRQLLENLTYSYLGEWIARQREGVKRGEGGAEDRLAAALELQKRLVAIIEGEPPFDIFVRWKPVEEQPIGWEPDINDGVRLNIRPFMAQDIPGGRKGAGILLIGVDDSGAVVGVSPDDIRRLNQLISNVTTDCIRPSINAEIDNVTIDEKLVMVITIPEGISKPYLDNEGIFWVKSGANKRLVTSREEIQRMMQRAGLVHADEVPVEGTTLDSLDNDHLNGFFEKQYGRSVKQALEDSGLTMTRLLNNLRLAKDETLNLAGLLLFGRDPQRHRPAFVVKAVSFVGNDPAGVKYRDSEDIGGCLRDMHTQTMSFITRNLRRIQAEKNFNTEGDLEIPAVAIEELVVNMLLHRDHFISAPWRIMIFDNRIELISPGALPNNLTIENIRSGVSVIRNPLIASFATKELPYRGIGTGILRALALVPSLELETDHERNLFVARIPRKG